MKLSENVKLKYIEYIFNDSSQPFDEIEWLINNTNDSVKAEINNWHKEQTKNKTL